jgi:hypothetical protein
MLSCGFGKRGLSLRRSRSSGVEDRDHSLLGEQLEELVGPGRRDAPVPGTVQAHRPDQLAVRPVERCHQLVLGPPGIRDIQRLIVAIA